MKLSPVIQIEAQQRPDNERIHRHPDRSPPVRVTAEHARIRLGRQIVYPVLLPDASGDMEYMECASFGFDAFPVLAACRNRLRTKTTCAASETSHLRRNKLRFWDASNPKTFRS